MAGFGVEYPRTHDLSLLLTLLDVQGQDVTPYLGLIELDPYVVQYRYGAFEDLDSPIDRSAVQTAVHALISAVSDLVKLR